MGTDGFICFPTIICSICLMPTKIFVTTMPFFPNREPHRQPNGPESYGFLLRAQFGNCSFLLGHVDRKLDIASLLIALYHMLLNSSCYCAAMEVLPVF